MTTLRLDYFTIRRTVRPRSKIHMTCIHPHCSWELEQVMKIVSGKEAQFGYTLESLQKRIDERWIDE